MAVIIVKSVPNASATSTMLAVSHSQPASAPVASTAQVHPTTPEISMDAQPRRAPRSRPAAIVIRMAASGPRTTHAATAGAVEVAVIPATAASRSRPPACGGPGVR